MIEEKVLVQKFLNRKGRERLKKPDWLKIKLGDPRNQNAVLDLINVFFINAPLVGMDMHTDAANMSAATGIPGIVWVAIWMGISLLMISFGLRLYAVNKNKVAADETVFESEPIA